MPRDIPDDTAWKVSGAGKLRWRCWDGEYVVFNPLTGDTHLLDVAAGGVLMDIVAGPATTDELVGRAADFLDVDSDPALLAYIKNILQRLDELGLVEPVP